MASSPFGDVTIVSSGSHRGAQVTRVWSGPSGWLVVASYPIDLYVLRWICMRLLKMSVSDHCTSHCCWAPALPLPVVSVMLVWSWYLISIALMLPLMNCFSSSAGLLNMVSGIRVRLELCLWVGLCLFVRGGSGVSVVVLAVGGGPCCCGCAACFCKMAVSSLSLCVRLMVGLLSAGISLRLGVRSLTGVYRSGSWWGGSWFE